MKNKIRERIIASVMLSAFAMTNLVSASIAFDGNYGYDYSTMPVLRSGEPTTMGMTSGVRISNADSIVNLSLRDADVQQVLRMFADQAGMNIIFSSNVSGTVTMDLVDIPLEKALNLVVTTNDLYYDIQANTLVVSTKDEAVSVSAKNMSLIPVRYVNASSIASFLNSNIFSKESGLNPGLSTKPVVTVNPATNDLIVMGTDNDAAMARRIVEQFDRKPTITTFKVNHTTPAEMADLICNTLLPSTISGGGSSGGGSSSTGGAASIEGVPTGFASDSDSDSSSSSGGSSSGGDISVGGGKLVCSIDGGSASGEGLNGLDLKTLAVSYFPTQGTVQIIGGSPSQIEMIRDYVAMTDKKAPQAYLEVQIISLSESGSKQFNNTWQFLSHNFSFNAGGSTSFSLPDTQPIFFAGRGFQAPSGGGGAISDDRQKWSYSPQLIYTVNYLVQNSKGRVLANPRVLLTSGQESTIELTSDYVTKVTTQYLDSTSGSGSSQVQRDYDISDDNGIEISITPFISPDGYVTLDITPEYSDIKEQLYTKGQTGEDELSATLLFHRNLELKGVRIKDGETLVIGGMIKENESKTVTKIPFLGDIPVLGMFFRSTGTRREKEEMVIMLTPTIVVDNEDAVGDSNVTL
ncbi:type II secretion system protein GspD [bacterium]|nr:type II secretion system protein GspD [bacterium]